MDIHEMMDRIEGEDPKAKRARLLARLQELNDSLGAKYRTVETSHMDIPEESLRDEAKRWLKELSDTGAFDVTDRRDLLEKRINLRDERDRKNDIRVNAKRRERGVI